MDHDAVSGFIQKMEDLAISLETALKQRRISLERYLQIHTSYQHKKINHVAFERECQELFSGKSKGEWIGQSDLQIAALRDQLSFFNKQIFFQVYSEHAIMQAPHKVITAKNAPTPARSLDKPKKVSADTFESLFKELESS